MCAAGPSGWTSAITPTARSASPTTRSTVQCPTGYATRTGTSAPSSASASFAVHLPTDTPSAGARGGCSAYRRNSPIRPSGSPTAVTTWRCPRARVTITLNRFGPAAKRRRPAASPSATPRAMTTVSASLPWKACTVPVRMRWRRIVSRSNRFRIAASIASACARNGEITARPVAPESTSSPRRSSERATSASTTPSFEDFAVTRWTVIASASWLRGCLVAGSTRPW